MKIAIHVDQLYSPSPGGIGTYVRELVPALARVSPEIAVVPRAAAGAHSAATHGASGEREVRVTVKNGARRASAGEVWLEAPEGWTVAPASAPVSFTREDEETRAVRFALRPLAGAPTGEYPVRARVSQDGRDYREGYQVIEYPHTTRRHVMHSAEVPVLVLDVWISSWFPAAGGPAASLKTRSCWTGCASAPPRSEP